MTTKIKYISLTVLLIGAVYLIFFARMYISEYGCNEFTVREYKSLFDTSKITVTRKKCKDEITSSQILMYLTDTHENTILLYIADEFNEDTSRDMYIDDKINVQWITKSDINIKTHKSLLKKRSIKKYNEFIIRYNGEKNNFRDEVTTIKPSDGLLEQEEAIVIVSKYLKRINADKLIIENLKLPNRVTLLKGVNGFAIAGDVVWDFRLVCNDGKIQAIYLVHAKTKKINEYFYLGNNKLNMCFSD